MVTMLPTMKRQSESTFFCLRFVNLFRFAPRMRRPLSGRKHFANIIIDAEKNEEIQKTKQGVDIQPKTKLNVVKDGVSVRHFSRFVSLSLSLSPSLSLSHILSLE
jgi:hypothetical protein